MEEEGKRLDKRRERGKKGQPKTDMVVLVVVVAVVVLPPTDWTGGKTDHRNKAVHGFPVTRSGVHSGNETNLESIMDA